MLNLSSGALLPAKQTTRPRIRPTPTHRELSSIRPPRVALRREAKPPNSPLKMLPAFSTDLKSAKRTRAWNSRARFRGIRAIRSASRLTTCSEALLRRHSVKRRTANPASTTKKAKLSRRPHRLCRRTSKRVHRQITELFWEEKTSPNQQISEVTTTKGSSRFENEWRAKGYYIGRSQPKIAPHLFSPHTHSDSILANSLSDLPGVNTLVIGLICEKHML